MSLFSAKRLFDLCVSTLALVLLSPVLLIVYLAVRIILGKPVIFSQVRPGLHGKPFRLYKFRSMTNARDAKGQLLPDAARLTRFGRFLRSSSLDEMPELINVIKGDMSLVGPRPLLMQYMERYTPAQMRRHNVRPGITGWAQVNGRNALSWDEKFALDVWYVEHQTFTLDLKILIKTFAIVMRREGISAFDHATMPEFRGK